MLYIYFKNTIVNIFDYNIIVSRINWFYSGEKKWKNLKLITWSHSSRNIIELSDRENKDIQGN